MMQKTPTKATSEPTASPIFMRVRKTAATRIMVNIGETDARSETFPAVV